MLPYSIDVILILFKHFFSFNISIHFNGFVLDHELQQKPCFTKLTHCDRETHRSVYIFASSFVQIIACRLLGTKPLIGPMMSWTTDYKLQYDLNQNTSIIRQENNLNMLSAKWWPLRLDRNVLTMKPCFTTLKMNAINHNSKVTSIIHMRSIAPATVNHLFGLLPHRTGILSAGNWKSVLRTVKYSKLDQCFISLSPGRCGSNLKSIIFIKIALR